MLKNLCRLESKVNDRTVHLYCDNDAPLEYVKESLFQFLKYIGQIEDQVKAQQEAAKAQSEIVPEPKEEVKEEVL